MGDLLAGPLVGRIEIRRGRLELGGTGIDELVDGLDAQRFAVIADLEDGLGIDRAKVQVGELRVGVAELLGLEQRVARDVFERGVAAQRVLELDELSDLVDEERIDARQLVDALDRPAELERVADEVQPTLARDSDLARECVLVDGPVW